MGVETLNEMRFTCDECMTTETHKTTNKGFRPRGWDTRYKIVQRHNWDAYLKKDILIEGYDSLLLCPQCLSKHLTWQELRKQIRT